jgi:hypothetical protein
LELGGAAARRCSGGLWRRLFASRKQSAHAVLRWLDLAADPAHGVQLFRGICAGLDGYIREHTGHMRQRVMLGCAEYKGLAS